MDTSYLSQQVTTIIERLHGFFDEIGVPSHERDSRESELFSALSETLHNQLNLVAKEKHELTEEAQRLIKTIRQMERSLDDTRPAEDFETDQDGLKVTFPLLDCLQSLKEKHHMISKLHRERFEQVKRLVEALESYASHLEPSFVTVKLPPTAANAKVPPNFDLSPTYVERLDKEFTRVYEEYNKRVAYVSQTANEVIGLWSELGTPQAQVDSNIVQFARDAPEQLGLHQEDLKQLTAKRDKLIGEKRERERKLKELRAGIESLWDRLGIEEAERKRFLAANRGCGLRTINEFEDELAKLNQLKRQNLHLFVEDARVRLQELWDGLYFSEEEMLDFTPAFSDVYSDALLSAHEQEIARLEALKEQRAPILAMIDRHRSLIQDREDLEKSSHDASRLMGKGGKGEKRDPGKLLREEKMRKRITKELPKVEAELRKKLDAWEDEYGRPFCVRGERYVDELESSQAKAPPTRSKTPNALPPGLEPARSVGRVNTLHKSGSVKGLAAAPPPPPPRSKTPTAHPRPPPALATSTMAISSVAGSGTIRGVGKMSPSKIPAARRLPLSSMRDGNNSPERRTNAAQSRTGPYGDGDETTRGGQYRAPPARMPPPKMRDLRVAGTGYEQENRGYDEAEARGNGVVRQVEPEDPYDDERRVYRAPPFAHTGSVMGPPPPAATAMATAPRPVQQTTAYPLAPPSRQASNTSSSTTSGNSGSENWETYTDASDADEADATAAYYARVHAQQLQRRQQQQQQQQQQQAMQPGHKRTAPSTATVMVEAKRVRDQAPAEGSEAGWTDDGDIGDTY